MSITFAPSSRRTVSYPGSIGVLLSLSRYMTPRSLRSSGWPFTIVWMPRSEDEISISHTLPSITYPFSSSSLSVLSSSSITDASAALASYGTPQYFEYSRPAFS